MTERFQIVSPDGAVYELTDVEYFLDEYAPKGFEIVTNPPADHIVPDVRKAKAERTAKAKAEADKAAKADAKAEDTKS